jgi:hypothetical protein
MKFQKSLLTLPLLGSLALSACQFDPNGTADINKLFANATSQSSGSTDPGTVQPSPSPSPSSSSGPGGSSQAECFDENFQQPEEQISRSVDLLFVADTSGSMQDNRIAVADGLHAFVGQLPSNVDYRIGMLLAHSSTSSYTGKLWTLPGVSRDAATGYPYVLDSAVMDQATIQARLRTMMQEAPEAGGQGEMGMYSLLQALTPEKLAYNRSKGFFRQNAALAVIFISDENDICAVFPENPSPGTGLTAAEQTIRTRDCASGISASSVIETVRNLQGNRPMLFGGIVNDDPNRIYAGNDGYSWGYLQILQQTLGLSVNIETGNYLTGLAQIGGLVTRSLDLILSRQLQQSPVDASTLQVVVDGALRSHTFVESTNTVHLDFPGGARSQVNIHYCKQIPGCTGSSCGEGPGVGI